VSGIAGDDMMMELNQTVEFFLSRQNKIQTPWRRDAQNASDNLPQPPHLVARSIHISFIFMGGQVNNGNSLNSYRGSYQREGSTDRTVKKEPPKQAYHSTSQQFQDRKKSEIWHPK